jgi:hypothetical protein
MPMAGQLSEYSVRNIHTVSAPDGYVALFRGVEDNGNVDERDVKSTRTAIRFRRWWLRLKGGRFSGLETKAEMNLLNKMRVTQIILAGLKSVLLLSPIRKREGYVVEHKEYIDTEVNVRKDQRSTASTAYSTC